MSTSHHGTPNSSALPLDGPTSSHSTPASYTSHSHTNMPMHQASSSSSSSSAHAIHAPVAHATGTGGTSTPTSTTSSSTPLDLNSLSTHPIYTSMFPDPDLPIANISRIMKRSLPDNAKIAKDAKECVQNCVSELISFITSEASDKCAAEKRKTINGDDILYAMRVLGFDNYEEVLRVYLARFRLDQENNPKARKRTKPTGRDDPDDEDEDEDEDDIEPNPDSLANSTFNSPALGH